MNLLRVALQRTHIGLHFRHLCISEDRCNGVLEFMRNAGGHFTKSRKIFFEFDLILQLDDLGEIG